MCSLPSYPAAGQCVHLAHQKIPHQKIPHQHDASTCMKLCPDPPDTPAKPPAPAVLHIWGAWGQPLPATWRYLEERSAGGHDPRPHEPPPPPPLINHLQFALRKRHTENRRHQHRHSLRPSIPLPSPADVPPVTPGEGGGCRGVGGHCSVGKNESPIPCPPPPPRSPRLMHKE